MTSRLDVPVNIWTSLKNFQVKYFNETIIDKLSLSLLVNMKRELKNADVIHLQAIFNTPTPVALYIARILNKPLLLSPRGSLGDWILNNGNSFKKLWLKLFIRPFADFIHWHATSLQERGEILKLFPKAKVHIVPNGIDFKDITNSITIRHESIFSSFTNGYREGPKIVSMGRIHAKKGFDILINAFKRLVQEYPTATLFIAGQDEGELPKLEQLVVSEGLVDRVFFTGQLNKQDKVNFLAEADVFALPSHNENFGNVYLESLACGTPIVASIHTPWEEVVEGKCGLWVNNTADEFYSAIKSILDHPDVYTKERCTALAQRYSWKSVGAALSKVFSEIQRIK